MGEGAAGHPALECSGLRETAEHAVDCGEDEGFDLIGEPAGLEEVHHRIAGFVAAFALEAERGDIAGKETRVGGGDDMGAIFIADIEGIVDDDFAGEGEEGEGTEAEGLNWVGGREGQAFGIEGGEHSAAAAGGEGVG